MREMQTWKETPTAPYSLKTFFSCWVLLGFPPSGSGSPGAFAVDEEVVEASFKFCSSWTKKESKTGGSEQDYEIGGWIENLSLENMSVRRWSTSRQKTKGRLAKSKWLETVELVSTLHTKSWHFLHSYSACTPQTSKLTRSEMEASLLVQLTSQFLIIFGI